MALVRRKREAAAATLNVGIDRSGSVFKSEAPADNQASEFIRYLIRRINSEYLSPADVVQVLSKESESLQKLFTLETLGSWSMLDTFWKWPLAQAARSSEMVVKTFGRGAPLWCTDDHAWMHMVKRACDYRGEKYPEYVPLGTAEMLSGIGEG